MQKNIDLYNKYFVSRDSELLELFRLLKSTYNIESAIYPGSFVHISPAYIFQHTLFVDSDKRIQQFFSDTEILEMVERRKEYRQKPLIAAFQQDYNSKLPVNANSFDLLISQFAGFVSQAAKQYLKKDGILLVNDSHGDATMAYLDSDFELIAVADYENGSWAITDSGLEDYFLTKNGKLPDRAELIDLGKGPRYIQTADNYIFRKNN